MTKTETPASSTDDGPNPKQIAKLIAALNADTLAALAAMRNRPPENRDDILHDIILDGITRTIERTLRSALSVFRRGDHPSSGALTRKALEYLYALVTLRQEGRIAEWSGRHSGQRMTRLLKMPDLASYIDKAKLAALISAQAKKGKLHRVTESELAEWAGLSEMHRLLYAQLNSRAHFDLVEAITLQFESHWRDAEIVDDKRLDRFIAAAHIQSVALSTLYALRDLGAANLGDALDTLGNRFAPVDDLVGALSEKRARRNAARSGWAKDGEADPDYKYLGG